VIDHLPLAFQKKRPVRILNGPWLARNRTRAASGVRKRTGKAPCSRVFAIERAFFSSITGLCAEPGCYERHIIVLPCETGECIGGFDVGRMQLGAGGGVLAVLPGGFGKRGEPSRSAGHDRVQQRGGHQRAQSIGADEEAINAEVSFLNIPPVCVGCPLFESMCSQREAAADIAYDAWKNA